MWLNSKQREEPGLDMQVKRRRRRGREPAGGAWCRQKISEDVGLSPQRAQPLPRVASIQLGDSRGCRRQAGGRWGRRQVIMPYALGRTRATMAGTEGLRPREGERIPKSRPQFRSEAATRLREAGLLVIADQHAAVNTFPGLVHTARHTTRVVCTRSRRPNPPGGGGVEGVEGEGGEVVTR